MPAAKTMTREAPSRSSANVIGASRGAPRRSLIPASCLRQQIHGSLCAGDPHLKLSDLHDLGDRNILAVVSAKAGIQHGARGEPRRSGLCIRCDIRAHVALAQDLVAMNSVHPPWFSAVLRVKNLAAVKTVPEHKISPPDDSACFRGSSRSRWAFPRRTRCAPLVRTSSRVATPRVIRSAGWYGKPEPFSPVLAVLSSWDALR